MRRLAGSIVSLLFVVLLACGISAIYVWYQAWRYPPRSQELIPSTIEADRSRGYVNRANLDLSYPSGVGQQFYLATNEQGARRQKPGGHVESAAVVAVGDSQTFGSGINYADTYPARLEAALGEPVLNLGVSGYGTVSALRMAKEFLGLRPKFVILGYYYDHATRSVSPCYPGFMLRCLSVPHVIIDSSGPRIVEPSDNRTVLETQRAYHAYITGQGGRYSLREDFYWKARQIWADSFQSSQFFFGRRHPDLAQQETVDEFLLSQLNDVVHRAGARLIILYIPNYFGPTVVPPPEYLVKLTKRLRIDFVDMTPDLQRALDADPNSITVPNNGHLNALGHDLMGRKLFETIRALPQPQN